MTDCKEDYWLNMIKCVPKKYLHPIDIKRIEDSHD